MYDWIPLAQTVLYALVLLFGLMVSIPVGITKEHFDGECPLYANLDGTTHMKTGDVLNCNYIIYMHVVLSCLLGGILTVTFVFILISEFKGSTIRVRSEFTVVLGLLILQCLVAFLSFVAACILTVGLKELCDDVEEELSTCKDAQHLRLGNFNNRHFYDHLTMAEIAAWLNLSCWIGHIALGAYVMVRVRNGTYPPGEGRKTVSSSRHSVATISSSKGGSGSQRSFA